MQTTGTVFVDQFGVEHELIDGYRSAVKPGWERMLNREEPAAASTGEIERQLAELEGRIRLGVKMLELFGCTCVGKRVLNIGGEAGEEAALLGGWGAASVIASNHTWSKDVASPVSAKSGTVLCSSSPVHASLVARLRESDRWERFEEADVSFVADDISASAFEDASFDIVCSWRTLEHLIKPRESFAQMHRVLRPGGFMFHEYNPFFCVEGGHSLVTLDFPWGHVRLAAGDVERYLDTFRPEEKARAWDYYTNGLNRMSIGEMERLARQVGFEIPALVPRARTEDLLDVTKSVLAQARRVYPALSVNDLVCRTVRVVMRRTRRVARR